MDVPYFSRAHGSGDQITPGSHTPTYKDIGIKGGVIFLRNMPTITFNRSDADPSQWPTCGRIEPGVYLDHLSPADEYVIHFLEKLASRLGDILNYPRELYF